MMKKYSLLFIILIISIFIVSTHVYAFTFNVVFTETGEDTGDEEYEGKVDPDPDTTIDLGFTGECPDVDGKDVTSCSYTCTYNWDVSSTTTVTVEGYDMLNNPLFKNSFKLSKENAILSGTSIGLYMREDKVVTYNVKKVEVIYNYSYNEIVCTGYMCFTNGQGVDGSKPNLPSLPVDGVSNAEECAAAGGLWSPTGCGEVSMDSSIGVGKEDGGTHGEMYNKCEVKAVQDAVGAANGSLSSSDYKVSLQDSNDIDGTDMTDADRDSECYGSTGKSSCEFDKPTDGATNVKLTDTKKMVTEFKIRKACIEQKTGKIRYINSESILQNCVSGEEIAIENDLINGEMHWHYFIPLNTKSTDKIGINIRLTTATGLTTEQCRKIMKENPVEYDNEKPLIIADNPDKAYYTELILKQDGDSFKGDYTAYCVNSPEMCVGHSDDNKEIENNGCQLTMQINIPANQQFYNEEEETDGSLLFKGFNFYYRPIDINNPFPKEITDNSIWKKYYERSSNKISTNSNTTSDDINISNSYEQLSYTTKINIKTIREYNKTNPYTSWENMNANGTSSFIDYKGVIERENIDYTKQNTYKLGCGPLNEQETIEGAINPLFRKECKQ